MIAGRPWRATATGLNLTVRLSPRAAQTRVHGVTTASDGAFVLKVHVAAPPADGRANAALIDHLAKTWRLPASAFAVRHGHTNRSKVLSIAGDPTELCARLEAWLQHGP